MEKRLRCYISLVQNRNISRITEEDKTTLREEMLIQIGFFQHERLVHLIVTVTFAILALISTLACFLCPGISFILLTVTFLILLIPYIRHYYILENGVQKLYKYYDELANKR